MIELGCVAGVAPHTHRSILHSTSTATHLGVIRTAVAFSVTVSVATRAGRKRVRVHLDRGRVLGGGAGFVGSDVSAEAVLVGNVVNVSVNAVGILVT